MKKEEYGGFMYRRRGFMHSILTKRIFDLM
jgi:hypothetical protein